MKRFTLYKSFLLLAALSVGLFTSCSDDEVNEGEIQAEIENVVIPSTDQLDVTCKRSAFVFGLEENGFNKALKNRMTNQVVSLNDMPEVVIVGNNDVENLTEEDYGKLADIFIHDGAIVMTRPTIIHWFILQFSLAEQLHKKVDFSKDERFGNELISEMMMLFENDPSDLESEEGIKARAVARAQSMSRMAAQDDDEIDWDVYEKYMTEPFVEAVGIRNSESKFVELLDGEVEPEMLMEEKTSVDEDGNVTITTDTLDRESVKIAYDAYSYGLYADEVARWINLDVAEQKAKARSLMNNLATRTRSVADATERVNSELEANIISHTFSGYYNYKAYGIDITRVVPINVDVNYAVVHSFDTGNDYYLIEQKLTSQNGKYCCPADKKKWLWCEGKNDFLCGPYMKELDVHNSFAYENGDTQDIRLPQENISPQNENGTTTYTDGVSFTLTGTVGVGKDGLDGSFWGALEVSSSKSIDMKDLTCYWNPDASTSDNSAKWKYIGNSPKGQCSVFNSRVTHDDVKPLLRADCFVQQNFVVRVTNPKDTENLYMTTQLQRWAEMYEGWNLKFYMTDSYNKKRDLCALCVDRLPRPLRTMEDWIMTFTAPEGVTVADTEKFLQEFFPKYTQTKLSFMSPYTENEKENDPAIKQYGPAHLFVQSFANELEESADYFRSQKGKELGVLPGEYVFTFKRQGINDKIQFKLTVPETGDAVVSDRLGIKDHN